MKKTLSTLTLFAALLAAGSAYAQSHGGNGTLDGGYEDEVQAYIKQLPHCAPKPVPDEAKDEADVELWINKIELVFTESEEDALAQFPNAPATAYLKMKAALQAVSTGTQNCHSLAAILSRPIADTTLKGVIALETGMNTQDELSKGSVLFEFARGSVRVARKAAKTLDREFFVPHGEDWDPKCGFLCDGQPVPDYVHGETFPQHLLDLIADTLELVNNLGTSAANQARVFNPYLGVTYAFLPVAQLLVDNAYTSLKTNMAGLSKEDAFIQLLVLKARLEHDVNDTSNLRVKIDYAHNMSNQIAAMLRACPIRF